MTSERCVVLDALDVSRETAGRLDALVSVLHAWSPAINLVAPASLPHVWRRHVLDSAQLLAHAPAAARTWLDLGSGAGFPGLVVAAIARDQRPDLSVTLIESDARKCAFLKVAAHGMGVDVSVVQARIESGAASPADVISARALAPIARLLDYAEPYLCPHSLALFPKGAGVEEELAFAARSWRCKLRRAPSLADERGVIVIMEDIQRVAAS